MSSLVDHIYMQITLGGFCLTMLEGTMCFLGGEKVCSFMHLCMDEFLCSFLCQQLICCFCTEICLEILLLYIFFFIVTVSSLSTGLGTLF